MNNTDAQLVGKQLKDMYGALVGKVIGTITDVDGSIKSIGADCGSHGLQQIPFEQIVVQESVVIFIPKWRLESQRLIKEKELTLRRLKALIGIVSDNDEMKEDAEIIREKYRSNLSTIQETEKQIKAKLEARLQELNEQMKSVKMLIFDAKVKSNENSEESFESVKRHTAELIEHITHETSEICNVQRRLVDLDMEVERAAETPKQPLQESAVSYLGSQQSVTIVATKLPEAPTDEPTPEPESEVTEPTPEPESEVTEPTPEPESEVTEPTPEPTQQVTAETQEKNEEDSDWLARMEAQ